jgi:hypothetical protein
MVAFLGLLPFYGRLVEADRGWGLWTCLAAVGLGLVGMELCRRRSSPVHRPGRRRR